MSAREERIERFLAAKVDSDRVEVNGKRVTDITLFQMRIDAEGKRDEYDQYVREQMAEFCISSGEAHVAARAKFGFQGKGERALYLNNIRRQVREIETGARQIAVAEGREYDEEQEYREAMMLLPDTTDTQTEINWVRAHIAMSRKDRNPELEFVKITPNDILAPDHGLAPSKSAVQMLQHFANRPSEFFKALLTEQKKKVPEEQGANKSGEVLEDDTSDLDSLLEDFTRGE